MTLILPNHVAAQLRSNAAKKTATPVHAVRSSGYEAPKRNALSTDDFIDPADIAEQVKQFLAYDGVVPKPVGWRVACLLLTIPDVSAGGVILVDEHRNDRAIASPQGVVIALGETAFQDAARFPEKRPWVNVGDRVLFQKYGGRMFQLRTGQYIAFLNDTEFAGVVDHGWLEEQKGAEA